MIIITKTGIAMVLIPAGSFQMGDAFNEGGSDERPVHTVTLDAFYLGVYEVTNAQYCAFLNERGNRTEGGVTWLDIGDSDCLIEQSGARFVPKSGYADHPVVEVSRWDAIKYCNGRSREEGLDVCYNESTGECDFGRSGYRLPTEAEWEYAARGGLAGKRYPWGGDDPDGSQCNFADRNTDFSWRDPSADDGYAVTAPVGSYAPNGYGLYDMAGNVYEWCSDWYDEDYYSRSPSSNPQGPSSGTYRVLRGGSWSGTPNGVRCAFRLWYEPTRTWNAYGFRCVRLP